MTTIRFLEYRQKKAAIDQLTQLAEMSIFNCDVKLANRLRDIVADIEAELSEYDQIEMSIADYETFVVNQNNSIFKEFI